MDGQRRNKRRGQFVDQRASKRARVDGGVVAAAVSRALSKNIEHKLIWGELATTYGSVSTAWTESTIGNMPTGNTIATRVGRTVLIHSVYLKGVLHGAQSNLALDDSHNIVRLVLAVYQGAPGLANLTTGGASTSTPISTKYYSRQMETKIWDHYYTLDSPGRDSTGYLTQQKVVNLYHKFKTPLRVDYSDDTINTSNRSLGLSMISDSSAVPNPGFVQGYWTVNYTDA